MEDFISLQNEMTDIFTLAGILIYTLAEHLNARYSVYLLNLTSYPCIFCLRHCYTSAITLLY